MSRSGRQSWTFTPQRRLAPLQTGPPVSVLTRASELAIAPASRCAATRVPPFPRARPSRAEQSAAPCPALRAAFRRGRWGTQAAVVLRVGAADQQANVQAMRRFLSWPLIVRRIEMRSGSDRVAVSYRSVLCSAHSCFKPNLRRARTHAQRALGNLPHRAELRSVRNFERNIRAKTLAVAQRALRREAPHTRPLAKRKDPDQGVRHGRRGAT